jgi:hypothetical protein
VFPTKHLPARQALSTFNFAPKKTKILELWRVTDLIASKYSQSSLAEQFAGFTAAPALEYFFHVLSCM